MVSSGGEEGVMGWELRGFPVFPVAERFCLCFLVSSITASVEVGVRRRFRDLSTSFDSSRCADQFGVRLDPWRRQLIALQR